MKDLVDTMKNIPNLENLELALRQNKLGKNIQNMLYFRAIMKYMTKLRILELHLSENKLGKNVENLKYLEESLK